MTRRPARFRPVLPAAFGLAVLAAAALAVPASAQDAAPPATAAPGSAPSMTGPTPTAPHPYNIRTLRDLVSLCDTPTSDPEYPGAIGLCVGYGSGVLDYHLLDTRRHSRARKVCVPDSPPTRAEARQMFIAWANNNPQYMDDPAANGIMRFLIATFPCTK